MRFNRSGVPTAAALISLIILAYLPAILWGGFVWDDDDYVTENDTLRDLEGLGRIWFEIGAVPQYYPLLHTALWIQYQLWELEPMGYHLVNVVFHALNAVMLWLVLKRLRVPGAFVAAAIFGVHPVEVESVAWVAELKNVLSGTFYLAAMLAYFRFDSPEPRGDASDRPQRRPWQPWVLALLLFVAALLCKTIASSMPVAILLLTWWKRGRIGRREIAPTLPFFVIGAPMGLFTAWMERAVVGAVGAEFSFSLVDRVLIAGRALWFYAGKILWPYPTIYIYPKWDLHSPLTYALTLGAIALPVVLWLTRNRIGRGPFTAVAFFGLTVSPALGLLNHYLMRYFFVADHFQYLASIGIITLAVALVVRAGQRLEVSPRGMTTAGMVVLVLLAVGTWRQASAYDDEETIWRDTVAKNPGAYVAYNNLGGILLGRGEVEEALRYLEHAVTLDPSYPDAQNNLGIALHESGRVSEAIEHYRESIELDPFRADAHINLGISLASLGRFGEAEERLAEGTRLGPDLPLAWYNLGLVRLALRKPDAAAEVLGRATQLAPGDPNIRLALARALAVSGRANEAADQFGEALRLRPGWEAAEQGLAAVREDPTAAGR